MTYPAGTRFAVCDDCAPVDLPRCTGPGCGRLVARGLILCNPCLRSALAAEASRAQRWDAAADEPVPYVLVSR